MGILGVFLNLSENLWENVYFPIILLREECNVLKKH